MSLQQPFSVPRCLWLLTPPTGRRHRVSFKGWTPRACHGYWSQAGGTNLPRVLQWKWFQAAHAAGQTAALLLGIAVLEATVHQGFMASVSPRTLVSARRLRLALRTFWKLLVQVMSEMGSQGIEVLIA